MKNPFLLAIVWIFFFLIEILFPWQWEGLSIRPAFSYVILGYVFFHLPLITSLFFAGLAFVFQSSFSAHGVYSLLPLSALLGTVAILRKKTFRENLGAETLWVFLVVMGSSIFTQSLLGLSFPWNQAKEGAVFLIFLTIHFFLAVLLYWLLEEPGALWEERLLAFRAKSGQLNLFEARQLKASRRPSPFKVQRRIRKRFGLDARW